MKKIITATLLGGAIAASLLGAGSANAADPYRAPWMGTWLVPSEITPGTYTGRALNSDKL